MQNVNIDYKAEIYNDLEYELNKTFLDICDSLVDDNNNTMYEHFGWNLHTDIFVQNENIGETRKKPTKQTIQLIPEKVDIFNITHPVKEKLKPHDTKCTQTWVTIVMLIWFYVANAASGPLCLY